LVGITVEEFKKNLGIFKVPGGVLFVNPDLLDITTSATTGKITGSKLKAGLMSAPAPGTFGNFPVNSLTGPQYWNFDFQPDKEDPDHGKSEVGDQVNSDQHLQPPKFRFRNSERLMTLHSAAYHTAW
jgi:hypothetical protein